MNPPDAISPTHRVLAWIAGTMLVLVGLRYAIDLGRPIYTDDFWWHLKLGEIFLQQRGFPDQDPFLIAPNPGPPFFHEWLFQVFVGVIDRVFQLPGLRLAHVLLGFATFAVFGWFVRSLGFSRLATIGFILLFAFLAYQRIIQFRPHAASILLFYLMLRLVCVGRLDLGKGLSAALVMVIWINMHSVALVVFPFLAAFLAARAVEAGSDRGEVMRLAGLLVCLAALVMLNPHGFEIYYFYFTHDANNPLVAVVDEWGRLWTRVDRPVLPWNSTLVMSTVIAHAVLVPVVGLTYLKENRGRAMDRITVFLLLSGALAIAATIYAVRFIWMLPLASMALLRAGESLGLNRLPARFRQAVPALIGVVAVFHFVSGATKGFRYAPARESPARVYLLHHVDDKFLPGAVGLLTELPGGHVYNPYRLGGYLAWAGHPRFKTMLDGRFDAYPREVHTDWTSIRRVTEELPELVRKYRFDYFLLPIEDRFFRLHYALKLLGWQPILHQPRVTILASPARASQPELIRLVGARLNRPAADRLPDVAGLAETSFRQLIAPKLVGLQVSEWSKLLRQALLNQMFGAAEELMRVGHERFGARVAFDGILAVCRDLEEIATWFGPEQPAAARARRMCATASDLQSQRS
ncbi:MAG: hypothetical protein R3200_00300 [Xanthomonadales bacterium]|nr:hypothetical protein [Xanthomonadales bacterium]